MLLAGGSALITHGIVDRQTLDLDAFTAATGKDFERLVTASRSALERSGYRVTPDLSAPDGPTMRSWLVQRAGAGGRGTPPETVKVQVCRDVIALASARSRLGPTLDPVELAANKVLAIYDRTRHRDFEDLHEITRRIPMSEAIGVADQKQVTPLDRRMLAECFRSVDRLSAAGFHAPGQASEVRAYFSRLADALKDGASVDWIVRGEDDRESRPVEDSELLQRLAERLQDRDRRT